MYHGAAEYPRQLRRVRSGNDEDPDRDHAEHDGIGEDDRDDLRYHRPEVQVAVAYLAAGYAGDHLEVSVVAVQYRGDTRQAETPQARPEGRAP